MSHAQDEFQALLEAAVDGIIVIDDEGRVAAFSRAAERMFGYAAAEVIGHNVSLLMPTPYREEHDGYLENYKVTGDARIIGTGREVSAQRKDGSVFPIYLAVGEFHGHGKRRFVGIIRDITEKRNYEERLRQREEELRLVFDHAPLATVIYDRDGRIVSANQALCAWLGYTPEEILELGYRDITHPDHVEGSARRMTMAFRGQLKRYTMEKRYRHKDGSAIHGLLHAGVVHDADGNPMLMVAQIEDRTRQVEAEREVRQHRERLAHVGRISLMGEMAAGLAHEINQPLGAITNYAQAARRMLESGQDPAEAVDALDKITMQALRAGDVIRRLRTMIRKRDSEPALVDVNSIVEGTLSLVEADARANDVRIRVELTPDLPQVYCDVVQVQQVLLNLVRNAIDAIRGNDSRRRDIVIRTAPGRPGFNQVEVADTGPGLEGDGAAHLFTPFHTTKPEGLGLGLSISRSLVESHGGILEYVPNKPKGAVFRFTIPFNKEMDDG